MNTTPFDLSLSMVLSQSITGLMLNSILLVVITRNPPTKLRKRGCLNIRSSAIADLITNVGNIGLCLYPGEARDDPNNMWPVKSYYIIAHAGFTAAFFMLFLLSIEVYILRRYPLTAHLKLTKRKTLWVIILLWLAAFAVASSNSRQRQNYYPDTILIIHAIGLMIAVTAVLMFRVVVLLMNLRRYRGKIAQLPKGLKTDNRLTGLFLLLLFVYVVSMLPYITLRSLTT